MVSREEQTLRAVERLNACKTIDVKRVGTSHRILVTPKKNRLSVQPDGVHHGVIPHEALAYLLETGKICIHVLDDKEGVEEW